jgi:Ca-activated chloride channel family protein
MKSSSSPADWTPDSPELTDFALKDGPYEQSVPGWAERRAAAEKVVARSAALRAEVGEIRRLADSVETDLAQEEIHRLSLDRRQAVLAYARNPERGLPRRFAEGLSSNADSPWRRFWSVLTRPAMGLGLAAATALSIALALWSPWKSASVPAGSVAANSTVSNTPVRKLESATEATNPLEQPLGDVVATDAVPENLIQPEIQRGDPPPRWDHSGKNSAALGEPVSEDAPGGTTATLAPALGSDVSASARSSDVASFAPKDSKESPRWLGQAKAKASPSVPNALAAAENREPVVSPTKASSPRRQAQTTREIPFQSAATTPLSTFPLKLGNTSYPQVRRAIQEGQLPSPDAVRLDELLNYFSYNQPAPAGSDPVSAHVEVADSPWSPDHRLVKIGVQARPTRPVGRPAANIVVLVSLSPSSAARLSWAQRSLQTLFETLNDRDSVALLLDGPRGRVLLPPTSAGDQDRLSRSLSLLRAEGAPRGLEGLRRAYALAAQHLVRDGINRVIWILDGEFSAEVGTREELAALIREQTEWGVLLSVLGFGSDPVADPNATPWVPTPSGETYASVASPAEARAALQRELRPDPTTAAEDVTVDVRFNPDRVDRWRLLSQENRDPSTRRAASKTNAAAQKGTPMEAGQSVTALYEIVPNRSGNRPESAADKASAAVAGPSNDLLSLQVGYRSPAGGTVQNTTTNKPPRSLQVGVPDVHRSADAATADYKFAAAVVGYGLLLRDSPYKGDLTWEKVQSLAEEGQGPDREGYRMEFLQLVRQARALNDSASNAAPPAGQIKSRP